MKVVSIICSLFLFFTISVQAQYTFDSEKYAKDQLTEITQTLKTADNKLVLSAEQTTALKKVLAEKANALVKPHMTHVSRPELQKMIDIVDERFHKKIMSVLNVPQRKVLINKADSSK